MPLQTRKKNVTSIESLKTQDFVKFHKTEKSLEILHPKLILIIEWNYFKMLNESVSDATKYLSIFWNAVNLKYKEISTPQVKVIITGIFIAKDDAAIDFILRSRNKENPQKFDELKLLSLGNEYFGRTFKKEANFRNYDSAVLMTNFTAGSTRGGTIRGQICNKNIIYVSDDANYGGIAKAIHELAHSFGLSHDSKNPLRGSPSRSLMEPYTTSPETYYWSDQSLE
ncbi:venom metalloproteinase 2, partial [Copidosoma floridanum]|uniref:venom metalloproteinase 2 n=1 Tax=Copidosoma floridanum TaxID=29053 RepID=UPI0006C9C898